MWVRDSEDFLWIRIEWLVPVVQCTGQILCWILWKIIHYEELVSVVPSSHTENILISLWVTWMFSRNFLIQNSKKAGKLYLHLHVCRFTHYFLFIVNYLVSKCHSRILLKIVTIVSSANLLMTIWLKCREKRGVTVLPVLGGPMAHINCEYTVELGST